MHRRTGLGEEARRLYGLVTLAMYGAAALMCGGLKLRDQLDGECSASALSTASIASARRTGNRTLDEASEKSLALVRFGKDHVDAAYAACAVGFVLAMLNVATPYFARRNFIKVNPGAEGTYLRRMAFVESIAVQPLIGFAVTLTTGKATLDELFLSFALSACIPVLVEGTPPGLTLAKFSSVYSRLLHVFVIVVAFVLPVAFSAFFIGRYVSVADEVRPEAILAFTSYLGSFVLSAVPFVCKEVPRMHAALGNWVTPIYIASSGLACVSAVLCATVCRE